MGDSLFHWSEMDFASILLFLSIHIFMEKFPIPLKRLTVTLGMSVLVAVLLRYGVIIPIILFILSSMIVSYLRNRKLIPRIHMLVTMVLSITAAGFIYLAAEGEYGAAISLEQIIVPLILYMITIFIIRHLTVLLYAMKKRLEVPYSWGELIWGLVSNLSAVPMGLILYQAQQKLGLMGLLFIAFPIVTISYVFRLYRNMSYYNHQLQKLNEVSTFFSTEFHVERTVKLVHKALGEMFKLDDWCLYEYDTFNQQLVGLNKEQTLKLGEGLSGQVGLMRTMKVYAGEEELGSLHQREPLWNAAGTVVSVPMLFQDDLVGVLTIASHQPHAYNETELKCLQLLASQVGVTLRNARKYQMRERRSHVDELTGLLNLRRFNELLFNHVESAKYHHRPLALLMLDIDFFKKVNDVHGHLAGNEVLKEVSMILQRELDTRHVAARYGGEEFAVILEGANAPEALQAAEHIRETIESHPFVIRQSIRHTSAVTLQLTVSIGLAVLQEEELDAKDLIRYADRAMYMGAKRAGRNRVAIYNELR